MLISVLFSSQIFEIPQEKQAIGEIYTSTKQLSENQVANITKVYTPNLYNFKCYYLEEHIKQIIENAKINIVDNNIMDALMKRWDEFSIDSLEDKVKMEKIQANIALINDLANELDKFNKEFLTETIMVNNDVYEFVKL